MENEEIGQRGDVCEWGNMQNVEIGEIGEMGNGEMGRRVEMTLFGIV